MSDIFRYCTICNTILSGKQRKYCGDDCRMYDISTNDRLKKGKAKLMKLIKETNEIDHVKLNSSPRAYKEAKRLGLIK